MSTLIPSPFHKRRQAVGLGFEPIFPSSEACARPSSTLLVLRVLQQKDVQGAEKTNVD